jgi:hypothetical protein
VPAVVQGAVGQLEGRARALVRQDH